MAFPPPPDSKSRIRKAGEAIAAGRETGDDMVILDQWRGAHGYALNTFQAALRSRIESQGLNVEFVQRLKRRNTVIDKLRRKGPDGSPLVRDLTSMHDLAGCRLIFEDVADLQSFRAQMHVGFGEHKLKNTPDKYDYIDSPKVSGYRGIHDVYAHHPRPHRRGDDTNLAWHGLKVEVQFRTRVQNSLATAVEIADLIDRERTKFGFGEGERGRFFRIASEIIARKHEGMTRVFAASSLTELQDELEGIEENLNILGRLSALKTYDGNVQLGRHNVLNIMEDATSPNGYRLDITTFSSPAKALDAANQAENDPLSINAVYVRSDKPYQLRAAYKNYFSDPTNFVDLLNA